MNDIEQAVAGTCTTTAAVMGHIAGHCLNHQLPQAVAELIAVHENLGMMLDRLTGRDVVGEAEKVVQGE